jgi:hypothetical protein
MLPTEISYKDLQVRLQTLGCCLGDKAAIYNNALETGTACQADLNKLAYTLALFEVMSSYNTDLVLIPEITVDNVVIQEEVTYENQEASNCITIEQADTIFQYLQDYCKDCFREYGYYDTGILPSNDSGGWVGSSGNYIVSRQIQANWAQTDDDAVDYIKNKSINGYIEEGNNITITGEGTLDDPYVITSSGGGGSGDTGDIRFNGSWIKNVDDGNIYISPQDGTTWLTLPSDTQAQAGSYVQLASVDPDSEGIYLSTNNGTSNNNWKFRNDGVLEAPGRISFGDINFQSIGIGNVSAHAGYYGVSLYCSVGYELNWQEGYLAARQPNSPYDLRPIYLDSLMEYSSDLSGDYTNRSLVDKEYVNSIIPSVGTWAGLNYPIWTSGTPFVKMDAAGSFILDGNTYLTTISGITAGGDLEGTYPDPKVIKLRGNSISSSSPTAGQTLQWNGTEWAPGAVPTGGSGGGGISYYFNYQNTTDITPTTGLPTSPVAVSQLGISYSVGTGSINSANLTQGSYTLVCGFVTIVGTPGVTTIPAGLWDFNIWADVVGGTGSSNQTQFQIRVYKYASSTGTYTLLAQSDDIYIYDPSVVAQYIGNVTMPQTTILSTDRIYIEFWGQKNVNQSRQISFHFDSAHPSHIHTTIPSVAGTGLVKAVNGVFQSPASTLVDADVSASAAIDATKIANGSVSNTEFQYLDGVTSSIQTQIGTKQNQLNGTGFVKASGTTISYDNSTYITGNQSITLSGDVSGTGSTAITTAIGNNKVTNAMLAQIATATFKGRTTASTGNVEDLTATQATALLDTFTSSLKGLAPSSGGGTTNFLRADGTWAAPAGGSGGVSTLRVATTQTNTTTTPTTITGLSFSGTSGSVYTFWGIIYASCTSNGVKLGWSLPSGSTISYGIVGPGTTGVFNTTYSTSPTTLGTQFGTASTNPLFISGTIELTNNGTVALQFYNASAGAATSTIVSKSCVNYITT